MDRIEFNSCISAGMAGKKFTHDQRKLEFCILAKKCSKNLPRSEAEAICSQPKPEKPAGTRAGRGSKCLTQVDTVIECLIKNTDFSAKDVAAELRNSVPLCVCGKKQTRAMKDAAMIASMTPEHRAALELMAQMKQVYAPKEAVNA